MKSQANMAKDTFWRVGAVFLILWLIAHFTGLLGEYGTKYETLFLQLTVAFYVLSRIPTAFRSRYTTGRKIQKLFNNVGGPLIGLWLTFIIVRWLGWFGDMDIGIDINYFLLSGIILLLIGYSVKSMRHKAGYWAARSILFTVGGVSIVLWIIIRLFDVLQQYEEYALVIGIITIGIGFILGGWKHPPSFSADIEEDIVEVEPQIKEEVYTVTEDVSITRDNAEVKIAAGSLLVPILTSKEVGGIYFGEGSYNVDAHVKVYTDRYRGVTVVSGRKWDSVNAGRTRVSADEGAFEDMGLTKEEVLEIARVQVKGKITDQLKKRLKRTHIDLPFVKIRETPSGEYVKVGPIEVEDRHGEERVRIGPWHIAESTRHKRFSREGLYIEIRSKNEDISIVTNGKTVFTKGDLQVTVNGAVTVKEEDISVVLDEHKKVLHAEDIKIISKDDRRILRTPKFELSLREDTGSIRRNGKIIKITNEKTLEEIRAEIDATVDELIKEVLDRGELKKMDALIKKFEQELG
jgi:hypothetical protein